MTVRCAGLQLTTDSSDRLFKKAQDVDVVIVRSLEPDAVVDPAFDITVTLQDVE